MCVVLDPNDCVGRRELCYSSSGSELSFLDRR